jgi:hypothetical protein
MTTLEKGENTKLIIRKHWFIFVSRAFFILLVLIMPFVIYSLALRVDVGNQFTEAFPLADRISIFVFLSSAWILFIWTRLFGAWTDYYLDMWIVTDKRIVDVEQKGLFHRETSTFRLERVQDVTVEIKGIIAELLNFGDMHVQTAGESREFIIRGVARPRHLRAVMLRESDRASAEAGIAGNP